MWAALDFDGVLHDYLHPIAGRKMGPPLPGALEAVKSLLARGHRVTVFTSRGNRPQHVIDWLRYYHFPELEVTNIKQDYDLILDDKARRFTGWKC